MPQLSAEKERERRKNAAARLVAGSAMIGGSAVAHQAVKDRTGVKGPIHALKDIGHGGVKAKHGKYAAGWLATRGVGAAGIPLAVGGASNLLARKPKDTKGVNIRRDVINESIDRTLPNLPGTKSRDERTTRQKITAQAPIAGGAALGGLAGSRLTRKIGNKGGKWRIASTAVGGGLGAAAGASAAVPLTRKVVDVTSGGKHQYDPSTGIRRVNKAQPGAIAELPRQEQKQLIARKKKQSKYSLASAGLGATALGLKAPALAGVAAKRLPKVKGLQSFASHAPKADKWATNVGIGSLGVGSLGSLNFARIQRAETKADQRATGIKKAHNEDLAKALIPSGLFKPKPIRFAGVRPGVMVRTPTGKTIYRRGSLG